MPGTYTFISRFFILEAPNGEYVKKTFPLGYSLLPDHNVNVTLRRPLNYYIFDDGTQHGSAVVNLKSMFSVETMDVIKHLIPECVSYDADDCSIIAVIDDEIKTVNIADMQKNILEGRNLFESPPEVPRKTLHTFYFDLSYPITKEAEVWNMLSPDLLSARETADIIVTLNIPDMYYDYDTDTSTFTVNRDILSMASNLVPEFPVTKEGPHMVICNIRMENNNQTRRMIIRAMPFIEKYRAIPVFLDQINLSDHDSHIVTDQYYSLKGVLSQVAPSCSKTRLAVINDLQNHSKYRYNVNMHPKNFLVNYRGTDITSLWDMEDKPLFYLASVSYIPTSMRSKHSQDRAKRRAVIEPYDNSQRKDGLLSINAADKIKDASKKTKTPLIIHRSRNDGSRLYWFNQFDESDHNKILSIAGGDNAYNIAVCYNLH